MKKIERGWWETNIYYIDIDDVVARLAQVAKKQDEIVEWINEHESNYKYEMSIVHGRLGGIDKWINQYEKEAQRKSEQHEREKKHSQKR